MADASTNSFGLFSYIGENGKVKNLNLVNVTVNISGGQAGGVAGTNKGTITGCTVSGSVTGESCVGGVAGWNLQGTITGCVASCSVLASDDQYKSCNAGGVAGKNSARITGCCFTGGSVTGENKNDTRAGGIVGYNDDGSIMDCYWQAGTGGPKKGIGQDDNNQSEPTKVEANGWEQYKENLEEYSITIMDGKPVPNVIKENGTVTLPETVQRVLDAARLFGL